MANCERCCCEHDGMFGSGRFCSTKCARSFSTVNKRLEINERVRQKLQGKFKDPYSDDEFTLAVSKARSWTNLGHILGFPKMGNVQCHLRKRVLNLNLDTSHFWKRNSPEDLLRNRPGESKGRLAKALLQIGRKHECEQCGLGPCWQDKSLTLQVDHINGDNVDHRPENLRFLCPNCHSQTKTFCWRNTKRLKTSQRRGFAKLQIIDEAKRELARLTYEDRLNSL